MMNDNKGRKFLEGTLIGLILGFLSGILLAPKSGKETRADIKEGSKKLAGDINRKVQRMASDLGDKADRLREVAKDLGSEAREESQTLIARAEVLKQDLTASTKNLATAGKAAKDETIQNVRGLMDEGAALMIELERVTKRMLSLAKDKLRHPNDDAGGEAARRVQELERNGHGDRSEP